MNLSYLMIFATSTITKISRKGEEIENKQTSATYIKNCLNQLQYNLVIYLKSYLIESRSK